MDDMKKIAKIKLSTIVCGAFIILSLLYFLEGMSMRYWSSQYAPGPGFIPRWIGGIMIVLSIIAFIQSFRREGITLGEILPKEKTLRINLLVCVAGLFFYLFFVETLGFVVTGSVLMIALFSRGTSWKRAIPLGILIAVICFFIFRVLLQVQVPVNQFGW